ncbi:MAG: hypothetical protein A2017_18485 [Lentisphaerae bacterium GWF2_44_16]|nr:MAG: hypothetical protein A2017_18485 [Lentisphaerae bacterium GWF2_44_16]
MSMVKNKKQEELLKSVWLGLVHIKGDPKNDILDGCLGAYTNVTAKVDNIEEFEIATKKAVNDLGLRIEEINWAMPILEMLATYNGNTDEKIYENALDTAMTEETNFDTFEGYLAEE